MNQIPEIHALQHIKRNFSKTTNSIIAHNWGYISGVITPKVKTESNPLANQNVRSITKSVLSFYSFPVPLKGAFTPVKLPALKYGRITNRGNKSASSNDKLDLEV